MRLRAPSATRPTWPRGWSDPVPFADELAKLIGKPVRVANDVEAAAGAEIELGAGLQLKSFLALLVGAQGLGGSVVLEGHAGRPRRGRRGRHVVVKIGGRQCPCGRYAAAPRPVRPRRDGDWARRSCTRKAKTKLFELMEEANRASGCRAASAKALDQDDALAKEWIDDLVTRRWPPRPRRSQPAGPRRVVLGGLGSEHWVREAAGGGCGGDAAAPSPARHDPKVCLPRSDTMG